MSAGPHLFTPALAYRVRRSTNTDTPLPPEEPSGQNPPDGAIFDYALAASRAPRDDRRCCDGNGSVVRRYSSDDRRAAADRDSTSPRTGSVRSPRLQTGAGMHRFVWDLREPAPRSR